MRKCFHGQFIAGAPAQSRKLTTTIREMVANDQKALRFSILQKWPKSCLSRMRFAQTLHEPLVRLEILVVLNLRVQVRNLSDMPRRMLVACGSTFTQRDIDKGPPEQDCGERVFSFNGPCRWIEQLITITVDLLYPRKDQLRGTFVGRPLHQKGQRRMNIGVSAHIVERPLFRLEVLKVRQASKVFPQMG